MLETNTYSPHIFDRLMMALVKFLLLLMVIGFFTLIGAGWLLAGWLMTVL
jgi:hypothetical protein